MYRPAMATGLPLTDTTSRRAQSSNDRLADRKSLSSFEDRPVTVAPVASSARWSGPGGRAQEMPTICSAKRNGAMTFIASLPHGLVAEPTAYWLRQNHRRQIADGPDF